MQYSICMAKYFRLLNQRRIFILLCIITSICTISINAAPTTSKPVSNDTFNALKEVRDKLDMIRVKLDNQETEIRTFEEKVTNHQVIIDTLREEHLDTHQGIKSIIKDNNTANELKILNLETTVKGLVGDLGKIKSHINDSSNTVSQCRQKITDLEKQIALQNNTIDQLQGAMKALADALQGDLSPGTAVANGYKSYRIKAGDNLEKIAKQNNTTIKAIKEINKLANDRIVVGQTIYLP